jgi:hypothetical protein
MSLDARVVAVRAVHALISLWFIACLGYVYYAGIARRRDRMLAVASGALVAEGVIVGLNGGDCPLGTVHRRYGDEKAFFELVLPKRAAKLAVPVLGGVALAGFALVAARPPRARG